MLCSPCRRAAQLAVVHLPCCSCLCDRGESCACEVAHAVPLSGEASAASAHTDVPGVRGCQGRARHQRMGRSKVRTTNAYMPAHPHANDDFGTEAAFVEVNQLVYQDPGTQHKVARSCGSVGRRVYYEGRLERDRSALDSIDGVAQGAPCVKAAAAAPSAQGCARTGSPALHMGVGGASAGRRPCGTTSSSQGGGLHPRGAKCLDSATRCWC